MSDAVDLGIKGYEDAVEIGRGGFAVVYRARQVAFDREVAVKVLLPLAVDETTMRRFERECRAMGSLSWHPNILTIYDAGRTEQGRPYLAMELAPDGSLGDRLEKSGALPWQEVVQIGAAIAGALEAAHEAGVLHCDVKPGNVLMTRAGQPALADFGIAAIQHATHTRTSTMTASALYAAPEVLDGQEPTAASDVYALGATLFALLAGKPAFLDKPTDGFIAVMKRVATNPVPDLRENAVPGAVCSAIERAMAKDPVDRWTNGADLHRALYDIAELSGDKAMAAPRVGAVAPPEPPPQLDASSAGATRVVGRRRKPEEEPEQPAGRQKPPRRPWARRSLGMIVPIVVAGLTAAVLLLSGSGDSEKVPTARVTASAQLWESPNPELNGILRSLSRGDQLNLKCKTRVGDVAWFKTTGGGWVLRSEVEVSSRDHALLPNC